MPAGRPTKYNPEMLDLTRHYIDNYDQEPYEDVMPMLASLAGVLSISKDTLFRWLREEGKEEFSYLCGELMDKQEKVLFNGSLKGDFNPTMSKLALTKHGYSDKQELTGDGGKDLIPDGFIVKHVGAKD